MSAASPRSARCDVTDSFFIERYSHVMHLVSNVEGKIAPRPRRGGRAGGGLARRHAVGRAENPRHGDHRRIREGKARRVYAGAVGYFAADGSMDTCIVLRTALVKDGTMYVQAGGGIVADSVPEAEYQETRQQGQGADERRRRSGALRLRRASRTVREAAAAHHRILMFLIWV